MGVNKEAYEKWGKTGLSYADQNMDSLSVLCKKHGIKLFLYVYPYPEEIRMQDSLSLQVSHWKSFAHKRNLAFCNLFPVFIRPGESPDSVCKACYIKGDIHWNKEGHRRVSAELLRFYSETGGSLDPE